jgi:hypothetical protein
MVEISVTEIYVHRFDLIERQQIKSFEFMVKRKNQECIITFYVGCHCYHQILQFKHLILISRSTIIRLGLTSVLKIHDQQEA